MLGTGTATARRLCAATDGTDGARRMETEYTTTGKTTLNRMELRSLREGWPMDEETRNELVSKYRELAKSPEITDRQRRAIKKALAH